MEKGNNVFVLIGLMLTLFACAEQDAPVEVAAKTSRLLMTHFSPSANPASNIEFFTSDITLGSNNRKANLAFGAASATNPSAGEVFLKTRFASATEPFITGTVMTEDYGNYTVLLANTDPINTNSDAATGLAVLTDDLTAPSAENAKVRFLHLGVGASNVDIYFYTAAVQPTALVSSLGYGEVFPGNIPVTLTPGGVSAPVISPFTNLAIGTYNYAVRAAGADPTSTPILKGTIALAGGRVYTLVIRGYAVPPATASGRGLALAALLHDRTL